jgi:nifR3 family TIM-barrel protein
VTEAIVAPLRLGPLTINPPVVLAPMAGVTSYPFRFLCRRFGAGLAISEMITARPLAEGREATVRLATFGPQESPRSLQLYGVDPHYVGAAVRQVCSEGWVDHIDLNFGCPVPKVTRRGGGAAIPARPDLLRAIIHAAVNNAGSVPVTAKLRLGIDDHLLTFIEAGRIAESQGCAAVTLHARTAAQLYDGPARWKAIAELKGSLRIPVIGNGDVWLAEDALRMLTQTGCDAIAVGRGCLGRPWFFREISDILAGRPPLPPPCLGEVADLMVEHAELLASWCGERSAMLAFRKHAGWYTKGFSQSSRLRVKLMRVTTLSELTRCLGDIDRQEPYPVHAIRGRRGKRQGRQRVSLPHGFLSSGDAAVEDGG